MHGRTTGFQGAFGNLTVRLPFPAGEFLTESPVSTCLSVRGVTNGDGAVIADMGGLGGILGTESEEN